MHTEPQPGASTWRDRVNRLADSTDGSTHEDGIGLVQRVDRVAAFGPAILAVRWAIAIASVALATQQFEAKPYSMAVWSGMILAYTVVRTLHPLRYTGDVRSLLEVIGEVVLNVACVVATGYWDSPFILMMLTAVMVAGFARGYGFALRIGVVSDPRRQPPVPHPGPDRRPASSSRPSGPWCCCSSPSSPATPARSPARPTASTPSPSTASAAWPTPTPCSTACTGSPRPSRPRSTSTTCSTPPSPGSGASSTSTPPSCSASTTPTAPGSSCAARAAAGSPSARPSTTSPCRCAGSSHDEGVLSVSNLPAAGWSGLGPRSGSGIYAVLPARGSVIGILAVEHADDNHFTDRDVELLRGFVEPVALAIDNARWFARLRTVGADEERTRIARDLHDRIGQSLAYMAFELDNIVGKESRGEEVGPSLQRLRDDVRGVIREVRDTLYDLRTDVSDTHDIADTLEAYVARIRERSSLQIELFCDRDARLPLLQEREMWRIAQEALTNVERHSRADRVRVLWRCNGESAALEITDNGIGFPEGTKGRLDSYGIMGMRERASSIGATLEVASKPNEGTRVRCSLLRNEEPRQQQAPTHQATGSVTNA